ncbi:MAG: thioredoxin-dependent thiol peroxidase [Chitinophagales bacterium]
MPEFISITHLKPGDKAPEFEAPDQNGNIVSSKQLMGKKYALYFYPNDDTETCTKEACNLRDNYPALQKKGIEIIGVSHAQVESKKKFTEKYGLPFTLLADTDQKIVKAFGVYGEKLFMGRMLVTIHRVTFIIDEKGIIERIIHKVWSGKAADQILGIAK